MAYGNPAVAAKLANERGIDDVKLEAELFEHLILPFDLECRRADDQDAPSAVAQHEFAHNQAGLDRLPQPHVIRYQEADARHLHSSDHRIELIRFDLDAAIERRLDQFRIRDRGRAPPDCDRETRRATSSAIKEPAGRRQLHLVERAGRRLEFPDDLQFLTERVVLNGDQRHEALRNCGVCGALGRNATPDVADDIPAAANLGELALAREWIEGWASSYSITDGEAVWEARQLRTGHHRAFNRTALSGLE